MKIHGWGRYPTIDAEVILPSTRSEWIEAVQKHSSIARGLGRSYGDSANNRTVLQTNHIDHYIAFDGVNGLLACEAGVSINEILRLIVPRKWFIPVTPGTSHVTIGGAIASDVHGKNHHLCGTFTQYVQSMELLLGTGEIVKTSPSCLPELFHATCGGMGLTGIILSATIKLKPILSSEINQTMIKASCLESAIEQFETYESSPYSVAWIDCLATGKGLGRSLLMLGEHATEGSLVVSQKRPTNVPINLPTNVLNAYSIKTFNTLYFAKSLNQISKNKLSFETYFYPLDKLSNWNRLYGKQGFIQYQFVIPKQAGLLGLQDILQRIAHSGRGSFLAVLKTFGEQNQNLLSFPREGYTLALDFKADEATFQLVRSLDEVVLGYGGRIYLTKDALMTEKTFKQSYSKWQEFEEVRARYSALGKFSSSQSRRLGLQ